MDDNEFAIQASAFGILRCLRALAQEASDLRMFRTLSALEDALDAAAQESGRDCAEDAVASPVTGQRLH